LEFCSVDGFKVNIRDPRKKIRPQPDQAAGVSSQALRFLNAGAA
jgi:hypothetical protein